MIAPVRNYAKPFSIAGFVFGEVYMLFTFLAPNLKGGPPVPIEASVMRVLVGAIFLGPFGAAAGMGVGLLVTGAISLQRRLRGRGAQDSQGS